MDGADDIQPPHAMAPSSRWLAALLLAVACVVGMPVEHAPAAAAVDAPAIQSSVVCEQSAPSSNAAEQHVTRFVRLVRPCDHAVADGLRSGVDDIAGTPLAPLMSAGRSWRGPPGPSRLE